MWNVNQLLQAAAELGLDLAGSFIVGDKAVFVRLLERPNGDAALATRTIERILDNVSWSALNEFKHTSVPN